MNKPPQPITGPTSVPHPAPSPGLTQTTYPPGQPTSLVFATPAPPQMNSAPQPRQFAAGPRALHQQGGYRALQPYYQNRPAMPTSAPRVQTSSGPRPVGPTHVYQPGSQMMMIPQQQLSFAGSPQGYFMAPGQYRAPYTMAPTQQYPVTSGTAGFYPGTSPAEYQAYEPSLAARERRGGGGRGGGRENGRLSLHGAPLTSQRYPAGAYYPAQTQYSPSVQPAPVMINPVQQQQQAPPPQQPPAQPQGPPKRERKPIRIRDPNQGGRDITEEIMSGGRSTTTPTPPQVSSSEGSPVQSNGEVTQPVTEVTRTDENMEPAATAETPPPLATADPEPAVEVKAETDNQIALPVELVTPSVSPAPATEAPTPPEEEEKQPARSPSPPAPSCPLPPSEPEAVVGDTVDAPVRPAVTPAAKEVPTEKEEPQVAPVAAEKVPEKEEEATEEPKKKSEKEVPAAVVKTEAEPAAPHTAAAPVNTATSEAAPPPTKTVSDTPSESECAIQPPVSTQETAAPVAQSSVPTIEPEPEPKPAPELAHKEEPPLSNGLPQDIDEDLSEALADSTDTTPLAKSDASQPQEPTPVADVAAPAQEKTEEEGREKVEEVPPTSASCPAEETTMQAAVSVPKKKRNMKELNNKVIGDLLDAFKEEQQEVKNAPEPSSTEAEPVPAAAATPLTDAPDETWEEKEDKQNAVSDPPTAEQKYQYKGDPTKPIDPEDKKRYDREFLLGFQFKGASMNKPEGLPVISDVVLDKANKTPLRPPDPARMMNAGPDFTPAYLGNMGRQSTGGGGGGGGGGPGGPRGPPMGQRRSQQGQRKEPRKIIITSMSLNDDVQLNKAEKAWKPTVKKDRATRAEETENESDDPESVKTAALFKSVRSILNKLTPQKFQQLMKQVTELTIDTEERLKGVIDLIFEKAISEPNFCVAYANMCRCLMSLKVPTTDKPGVTVNFRKLLLNRCQKEFEKDQDDDEIFEKKQKEMEAAKPEDQERLQLELTSARDQARRRSLGNIKFIGELFKLKMLTEAIMHDCVVKLLKNHDEESLECLCRLLTTIGKDLDFEKAKPRMDQYFKQMDKIITERKTSSRIRFMLQDIIDLRRCSWVPRRGDQGPKTIDQIHKDAEQEEHRELIKVQQQMFNKKDGGGRMGGGMGGRGSHNQGGGREGREGREGGGRPGGSQPQDEGWNTVPISTKNRPIDPSRLSKITKPVSLETQLLMPGGKGMWGSWGKGSSGGTTGAKPVSGEPAADPGRPATSTVNRFSALQAGSSSSADSDRRVPQRSSSSRERGGERDRGDRDRFDRFDRREGRDDGATRPPITKRSFSRESEERGSRGGDGRSSTEPVRRVASMTDDRDRGSRDRASSKEPAVKRENAPTPPPALTKPALSEDELEKKAHAIVEEYLHINDLKEALQCVAELNCASLLFVFVRNGLESTLERSTIAREHMGLLLQQLVKAGTLTTQQYYKGLMEILEVAEDMAIDIPHFWLYLAELITPMLHEGGIPMGPLFREIAKPLVPLGQAGVLLVQILTLLCKGMTHKKVGAMWTEGGLNWSDFLPKDEDVNKFVTEQKVEFTLGEEPVAEEPKKKKVLSAEELSKHFDRLIQDKANNQRIRDWIEANVEETQTVWNHFVRALMTSICQSAIICENPYKVDVDQITQRASLLQRYLSDEHKELQALYALQALMVHMEQPPNLLRMFFDTLYDEDVIKEEAFYKWESSKDPAEQTGKGVALKSVTAFFTWLREAEDESDKD